MKYFWLLFIAIGLSITGTYTSYITAPADITNGDLYRILYVHVPSAWVCYLAFSISLIASILYLLNRKQVYDTTAELCAIFGLVYGAIALTTGSIWAHAAWGSYWNWDPRETTTLILWIAYLGYLSIKFSIEEVEKKRVIGSVYNILAFLTVPLSYLSIILIPTLHPQIMGMSGISLTPPMILTLGMNLLAATALFFSLLSLSLTVRNLERRVGILMLEQEEHREDMPYA